MITGLAEASASKLHAIANKYFEKYGSLDKAEKPLKEYLKSKPSLVEDALDYAVRQLLTIVLANRRAEIYHGESALRNSQHHLNGRVRGVVRADGGAVRAGSSKPPDFTSRMRSAAESNLLHIAFRMDHKDKRLADMTKEEVAKLAQRYSRTGYDEVEKGRWLTLIQLGMRAKQKVSDCYTEIELVRLKEKAQKEVRNLELDVVEA